MLDSASIPEDVALAVESVSETVTQHGGSQSIKLASKNKALELLEVQVDSWMHAALHLKRIDSGLGMSLAGASG